MGMHFHRYEPSGVATSGGSWSGNTIKINASLLRQVYIRSASVGTTFDAWLIDYKDRKVRSWTTATEVINDLTPQPVEGILTVVIDNASADEAFEVFLCFSENT